MEKRGWKFQMGFSKGSFSSFNLLLVSQNSSSQIQPRSHHGQVDEFHLINSPFRQEHGSPMTPYPPWIWPEIKISHWWCFRGNIKVTQGLPICGRHRPGCNHLMPCPPSNAKRPPGTHCNTKCDTTQLALDPITLLCAVLRHECLFKWATYSNGLLMPTLTWRGTPVFSLSGSRQIPWRPGLINVVLKATDPTLYSLEAFLLKV